MKTKKGILVLCPDCGGDGKETCHNPDHGFISGGLGGRDVSRIGCPCCGHDPDNKVINGGLCETCDGSGKTTIEKANNFMDGIGYDFELEYKK